MPANFHLGYRISDVQRRAHVFNLHNFNTTLNTLCTAENTPNPRQVNSGVPETGTYDFWAVGKNCCGDPVGVFRCGDWHNPAARSGPRSFFPAVCAPLEVHITKNTSDTSAHH